jgi:IstB-like ATP binding protein
MHEVLVSREFGTDAGPMRNYFWSVLVPPEGWASDRLAFSQDCYLGRYGNRSTIITSQIPVDKWHELIGDPTYTDAILDRIVHNAHRINLTGQSLRRSRANKPFKD